MNELEKYGTRILFLFAMLCYIVYLILDDIESLFSHILLTGKDNKTV